MRRRQAVWRARLRLHERRWGPGELDGLAAVSNRRRSVWVARLHLLERR
jgi:hypothetical protein